MKVAVIVGTRPEAIKLAPVVRELNATHPLRPVLISTGQHREMLDQTLRLLDLCPDHDLRVMTDKQDLAELTGRLVMGLSQVLRAEAPDIVLVQGDTTSCLCGALAAFYLGIPVGHVEAGLRSGVPDNPFPEEANRSMAARLSRWHFAPTEKAVRNLLDEGVPSCTIDLTGNTVVDSLSWLLDREPGRSWFSQDAERRVLVTLHRRESQPSALVGFAQAIARIAKRHGVQVVLPLHRNPAVRAALVPVLAESPCVRLVEPLGYPDFLASMADSHLVLSDSGGVVEEAVTLGIQTLVLRDTIERPEALESGIARLVGVDSHRVSSEALRLLDSPPPRERMPIFLSPFGDGRAAERIVARLAADIVGRPVPTDTDLMTGLGEP